MNKAERQVKDLEVSLNAASELRESAQQQLVESGIQCNALRRQAENDEEALRVARKIATEAKERDEAHRIELEHMKMEVRSLLSFSLSLPPLSIIILISSLLLLLLLYYQTYLQKIIYKKI